MMAVGFGLSSGHNCRRLVSFSAVRPSSLIQNAWKVEIRYRRRERCAGLFRPGCLANGGETIWLWLLQSKYFTFGIESDYSN